MKPLCLLCTWHALANLWVRMLENAFSMTDPIVIGLHWLRSISFSFSMDLGIGVIRLPFRQFRILPLYTNALNTFVSSSPFGSHSRRASRFTSSGPGAVVRSIFFTALNTSSEAVGLQNGAGVFCSSGEGQTDLVHWTHLPPKLLYKLFGPDQVLSDIWSSYSHRESIILCLLYSSCRGIEFSCIFLFCLIWGDFSSFSLRLYAPVTLFSSGNSRLGEG